MERRRTVSEYRAIDLLLFSLMVFAGEMVIVKAAGFFTGQPYVFSIVPLITAIVMMRWGPWAAIHAVLGGLAMCIGLGAAPVQYFIYCGGNLLGLGALGMLKLYDKEDVRKSAFRTVVFGLATVLLMQLGRALVSMVANGTTDGMTAFFLVDVLTLLFTAVAIWIVRRLDGVFEDQINYLLRINREEEEERESSDEG